MSWGTKIAIFYTVFVVILVSLVISSFTNQHQLVTEDYYGKELVFEAHQEAVRNAAQLSEEVTVGFIEQEGSIALTFPKELTGISGEILIYRPSDATLDQRIPVSLNSDNQQVISATDFQTGVWRIQISWQSDAIPYYSEAKVYVEKEEGR